MRSQLGSGSNCLFFFFEKLGIDPLYIYISLSFPNDKEYLVKLKTTIWFLFLSSK